MAIHNRDREDLIRDASGLPLRGELSLEGFADPIVVGFRPHGEASWFFGADPVYQFDAEQRLRRLFVHQTRYAASTSRHIKPDSGLVRLSQEQRGGKVRFSRIAVTQTEFDSIQRDWEVRLELIRRGIENERVSWGRCSEAPADFQQQVIDWVNRFPRQLAVARSPRLKRTPKK